ncbi:uncharacterized protein PAC_07036 [Phialocephala subalpina]|uniref:GH16 domain-containing protein n=1 Tax=Phialocephala subalpina TaxID=576137 RepID=A0A1L7WWK7_9HELO|nr:uncharacterized protein PAC_07036 [Phialocephala subalpina]
MHSHRFLSLALAASLCRNTVAEPTHSLLPRDLDCSCGFQDPVTAHVFTESIIVYFNETTGVLQDFGAEVYTNNYEKSWNSIYRQGADARNVILNNTSGSLELVLSPPAPDHVVYGGGIRTLRSDIHYGSFRSLLRPSGPYKGGSSMSMILEYNNSQAIQLNVMNTDTPATAWTSTLIGEEFPDRTLGANFSVPGRNSTTPVSSWDYTEYRIDWTEKDIRWYIGNTLTRTASSRNLSLPSVPCPIFLKHWSTGNAYAEQGPPSNGAVANVAYSRLFFNSSLMAAEGHKEYDSRCASAPKCSTEDWTLRGSTPYIPEALQRWKQAPPRTTIQWIAIWMVVVCIICSTILLMHTLIPRILAKLRARKSEDNESIQDEDGEGDLRTRNPGRLSAYGGPYLDSEDLKHDPDKILSHMHSVGMSQSAFETTMSFTSGTTAFVRPDTNHSLSLSMTDRKLAFWQQGGSARSVISLKREFGDGSLPSTPRDSRPGTTKDSPMPGTAIDSRATTMPGTPIDSRATTMVNLPFDRILAEDGAGVHTRLASIESVRSSNGKVGKGKGRRVSILPAEEKTPNVSSDKKGPLTTKPRVEYLAGLTAMCAIIVSVDHFCSTFVPAVIFPGAPHHYISEVWANKIVTPYLMNQIWIGVFFTCSTRFLVSRYLKAGELEWIAQKAVTRNFRVMIPIVAVAMLEYLLMECGATTWLEYLPSVTWSTWPYTTPYNTFGDFLSKVLEVVYLVPNAAPQIIFNYCTGVLWTMPIQLQGSWVILLGVVVIREIKNPYKRFGYYAMAVVFNWYASSWGTYFWLGLLLADLDIVFKYRKHIQSRPWLFYLLTITYGIITLLSLSVDTINQVANYSFIDAEHSIHPDQWSGLPIYKANPLEANDYFIPRLNGITFAFSLQSLIELSSFFQNIFACKPLTLIFPHIFTIYLFHGLIFWSLGAMICVFLSSHGFVYGVNLFIVAISCYAALFLSLPVITPIVELLGKHWTASIWQSANETPPPKRDTLFPFSRELLSEERTVTPDLNNDGNSDEKSDKNKRSSKSSSDDKKAEHSEKGYKSRFSESVIDITEILIDPKHNSVDSQLEPVFEDHPSTSKKRVSDRSSKGLEYLRELEKRQSARSATSAYSLTISSSLSSKRESQRSGLSVQTSGPLSTFPEVEVEVELQVPARFHQTQEKEKEKSKEIDGGGGMGLEVKKHRRESRELSQPLHISEHLASPDPVRPRASTRSSFGLPIPIPIPHLNSLTTLTNPFNGSETAGLAAQQKRRESSTKRSPSTSTNMTRNSSQQIAEVVGETILHSKLSVSEVREIALQQARVSRELKRLMAEQEEGRDDIGDDLGKRKGKERDGNGISVGYVNVYGPEVSTASLSESGSETFRPTTSGKGSPGSAKGSSRPGSSKSSKGKGSVRSKSASPGVRPGSAGVRYGTASTDLRGAFMVEVTNLEHEHENKF